MFAAAAAAAAAAASGKIADMEYGSDSAGRQRM